MDGSGRYSDGLLDALFADFRRRLDELDGVPIDLTELKAEIRRIEQKADAGFKEAIREAHACNDGVTKVNGRLDTIVKERRQETADRKRGFQWLYGSIIASTGVILLGVTLVLQITGKI